MNKLIIKRLEGIKEESPFITVTRVNKDGSLKCLENEMIEREPNHQEVIEKINEIIDWINKNGK